MYILVKDNQVFYGPNQWNPKLIQSYIEDDFEIEKTVPQTVPASGTDLGDGITVYKIFNTIIPEHNPKIHRLEGPFYSFENDTTTQSFTIVDKELDQVRQELKAIVANSRWTKEISGVEATVQGTVLKLTTQRGERDIYLQALQSGVVTEWKLVGANNETVWLTLPVTDLQIVVNAIVGHIQSAFSWEKTTCEAIDNSSTLSELDLIDLGNAQSNMEIPNGLQG